MVYNICVLLVVKVLYMWCQLFDWLCVEGVLLCGRVGIYDIECSSVGYLLVIQDVQCGSIVGVLLGVFGDNDVVCEECIGVLLDQVVSG